MFLSPNAPNRKCLSGSACFRGNQDRFVLPALIRRFDQASKEGASEVIIWGNGNPRREFLHVDDMATASLFVVDLEYEVYREETQEMLSHINVGSGTDVTIRELAETVAKVTGFKAKLGFDTSRPDGAARKLMDVSRLARLGWKYTIGLEEGIRDTYDWFLKQRHEDLRAK